MRNALVLGQAVEVRVPAIRAEAKGVVDWNSEVIAQLRTRDALRLILVKAGSPLTGEIDLSDRRDAQDQ